MRASVLRQPGRDFHRASTEVEQVAGQLDDTVKEITSRLDVLAKELSVLGTASLEADARSEVLGKRLEGLLEQQAPGVDLTVIEHRLEALETAKVAAPAVPRPAPGPPPDASVGTDGEDPSLKPLLESARHIQIGNFAAAIEELERAKKHSKNPKLDEALKIARRMLAEQKT